MPSAIAAATAAVEAHELRARNPVLGALGDGELDRLARYFQRRRVEAGARIVRQGDLDRATYFVLAGEARVVRGGVDVGAVGPGGHFGEFALVADRPRSATVVAGTEMELACLPEEGYRALGEHEPALALK